MTKGSDRVEAAGVATQPRRALVVAPSPGVSASLAAWLEGAGFTAVLVPEFQEARAAIDFDPPALVVSEVKLGAYNGLHLAIRIRSRGARTPVVLLGDPDSVLEAEAERFEVAYVRLPATETALLAAIDRAQPEHRSLRRSPRKRVPLLEALVDNLPVRVLDVSYEGLRFQVQAEAVSLPSDFIVSIPNHNVSCRAQRIWMSQSTGAEGPRCGATLLDTNPADAVAWRALVDSVPDRAAPAL
jgi:DNA-binding response OmpR family regulator